MVSNIKARDVFSKQSWIKAAIVISVILVTHVFASLVGKTVGHYVMKDNEKDATANAGERKQKALAITMVGKFVYWVIMIIVLLMMPSIVGIETAALIAVLGSVLFAVGLGLQGALSDLAVGVMLLGASPYRIGEHLEVQPVEMEPMSGLVTNFNILHTYLTDHESGITTIVPNRIMYESSIRNASKSTNHVAVLEVTISNSNKNLPVILPKLRDQVQKLPGVLDEEGFKVTCNVARVTEFGTTIEVRLTVSLDDYQVKGTYNKQAELMTAIRNILEQMGVRFTDISNDTAIVASRSQPMYR